MSMRRARESSAALAVAADTAVDVVRAGEAVTAKAAVDADLDANLAGKVPRSIEFGKRGETSRSRDFPLFHFLRASRRRMMDRA